MSLPLRPYQQDAVDAVYAHLRERDDNPCIVLPTGCHAAGHPILMCDGTLKPVEEIAVGDLVMGPDSQPRCVERLCRGEDSLYRVIPFRGEPFVVNAGHVLSLVCTNEGKRGFACYKRGGEIDNITVGEYLTKAKSWRHLRKLRRVAIEFSARPLLPVPPYILGLLLGDGSLTDHTVGLTTADEEIADAWTEYANSINCGVTIHAVGTHCASYRAVKTEGVHNVLTGALDQLGLMGHASGTKFVPHAYLVASRHERLSLLAGLIDSDGSRARSGIDYITQSRELATDILFLTRSLGFAANCTRKFCSCQTGGGGWFYRLSIWGDFSVVPCRLSRRVPSLRHQPKCVLRTGFRIEPVGRGQYFGFQLAGDHLYVDGNFVVHHNSGKTPVMATLCRDAVGQWNGRVLVLAHVKELLEQTLDKVNQVAPELWRQVGVYSAGLKSRDTEHPIIVAGIQSVYRRACDLGPFDLVLVDEAHMIPPDGDGMYRTFIEEARVVNPNLRVVGLTATPFRMTTGPICGPDSILNSICYEIGVRELIVQGYLCQLVSKGGREDVDTGGLHVRGGEFVADEVEALMDQEARVASACKEILEYTRDRNSCLVFTSGIQHAQHVAEVLRQSDPRVATVFGETSDDDRGRAIAEFRAGHIKYLVNCQVLTHGFDAPNVDCVAMLRPTMSPGLYYQCVGRGFRLHPGKKECLILDFGGNVLRHGPVDAIRTDADRKGNGNGEAPAKKCPECNALIATGYATCPQCGYVFPPPERRMHDARAGTAGILSDQIEIAEHAVQDVSYSVHAKRDAPADAPLSMRVEYRIGWHQYVSEWVCPEHTGYARVKFVKWWADRSWMPPPTSAEEAVRLAEDGALAAPRTITVRRVSGERFGRVVRYELAPKPEYYPEPGWNDCPDEEPQPAPALAWADDDDIPF